MGTYSTKHKALAMQTWALQSAAGTLEAGNFRLSELRGTGLEAFDLKPWNRLLRLSDSTGVVGV